MKKEDLEVIHEVHYISTCNILGGKQSIYLPDYLYCLLWNHTLSKMS